MFEWIGPISRGIKFVGDYVPFVLRWYYTEEKFRGFLLVDISSSGVGAYYNFSGQEAQSWPVVTNLSPFDFTVERLRVTASMDGGSFECSLTEPKIVKACSRERIYVHGKCPMSESTFTLAKKSKSAHVTFEIYVNNAVRPFSASPHIADMRNLEII